MEPDDIIESLIEGVDVEEADEVASTALKPKTRDEIEGIVQSAIDEAVSFVEGEISPARIKAQKYYDGHTDLGHEDGRSGVVATKVRDTVRAVKPSLMRVFLSTSKPVEYTPKGQEDVAGGLVEHQRRRSKLPRTQAHIDCTPRCDRAVVVRIEEGGKDSWIPYAGAGPNRWLQAVWWNTNDAAASCHVRNHT